MHAWHPVVIHLPLVALLLAVSFDLAASLGRSGRWRDSATPLWWLGLIGAAAAVTTGLLAYNRVDHSDQAHEVMTLHRNIAYVSLAILVATAVWRWRRPLARGAAALGVIGAFGLAAVGYLGGEMVYRYGLGIPNQCITDIARERGMDEYIMGDSTMSRRSTDSTAVADTAIGAAGAKKPHTHAPGQEH